MNSSVNFDSYLSDAMHPDYTDNSLQGRINRFLWSAKEDKQPVEKLISGF